MVSAIRQGAAKNMPDPQSGGLKTEVTLPAASRHMRLSARSRTGTTQTGFTSVWRQVSARGLEEKVEVTPDFSRQTLSAPL